MSKDPDGKWKQRWPGMPTAPCRTLGCVSNDGCGICVEWSALSEPRRCSMRSISVDDLDAAIARAKERDEALTSALCTIGAAVGLKTESGIIPTATYIVDIVRDLKAGAGSAAKELPALRRQLAGAEALALRLQKESDELRAMVAR